MQCAALASICEKSLRMRDRSWGEEQATEKRHHLVVEEDWEILAATEAERFYEQPV